jgi:DNA-binding transcriptional MerR regulator
MIKRRWSQVCLLLLFLGGQGVAQEEVVTYLNVSEPVISQMQSNIRDFLNEVQPLRQQKDIAGVKKVADKYILIWDDQLDKLAQITPPAQAETHYQALKRLLELQRESNQIMSETLAQRLALLMQIQQMEDEGATEDEIKEFLATNTPDKAPLLERATAVSTATKEADQTLKEEHQRLRSMVPEEAEGDADKEG